MTYEQWIEKVKGIVRQYDEGAIFANEAFDAIIARAFEVDEVKKAQELKE